MLIAQRSPVLEMTAQKPDGVKVLKQILRRWVFVRHLGVLCFYGVFTRAQRLHSVYMSQIKGRVESSPYHCDLCLLSWCSGNWTDSGVNWMCPCHTLKNLFSCPASHLSFHGPLRGEKHPLIHDVPLIVTHSPTVEMAT